MATLVYRGDEPNLRVLADEVRTHPELGGVCAVQIIATQNGNPRDGLRHGPFAEIVLTITSGVATSAVYDALRLLLDRARDRGQISDEPNDDGSDGQDQGGGQA